MKGKIILLGLMAVFLLAGTAKATTYTCNSCSSCTSAIAGASTNDIVQVTSNISYNYFSEPSYYCIIIPALKNGVTLDCQGNSIIQPDQNNGFTIIFDQGTTNNVVKNCNTYSFIGFSAQGYPNPTSNNTFLNDTCDQTGKTNKNSCFYIQTLADGNIIKDSTSIGAGAAVSIEGNPSGSYITINTVIDNLTAINNGLGIGFTYNVRNTTVKNSRILNNSLGIFFYGGTESGNLIYNNIINNSDNIQVYGQPSSLNTSKANIINIIGGSQVGGNYWAYPNGTGYSQTCNNTNNDSFCDSPYTIDSNNIDFLPLTSNYPAPPTPSYRLSSLLPPPWNILVGIVLGAGFILFILGTLLAGGIADLLEPKNLTLIFVGLVVVAVFIAAIY